MKPGSWISSPFSSGIEDKMGDVGVSTLVGLDGWCDPIGGEGASDR